MLSSSMMIWLRSFDAVARNSSFTRAASELCVSQGALSQQVKHLESSLGCQLFYRRARSLALTHDGEKLHRATRDSLRVLEDALAQLRRPRDNQDIALSCSPSFAMGWLTPRLGNFFREHATIHLKIHGEFHWLDRSSLMREGLSAAVRYDLGHYDDLVARPFLNEWLFPVASPGFLTAHPVLESPADLRPEWLLHDSSPWAGAEQFEEWAYWFKQVDAPSQELSSGHFFNLSQLALAAAKNGQGIAMGRLALVYDDLLNGRLIDVFGIGVPSPAAYVFVSQGTPSGPVAVVEAWLRKEVSLFLEDCRKVVAWLGPD